MTVSLLLALMAMAPFSAGAAVQRDTYTSKMPEYEETLCRFDHTPGPDPDPVENLWIAITGMANHYCAELYVFVWYYPPGVYPVVCFATGICPIPPPAEHGFEPTVMQSAIVECGDQPYGQAQACWVVGQLMCRIIPIECPEHCPPGTPPNNYYCAVFHEILDDRMPHVNASAHGAAGVERRQAAGEARDASGDLCTGEVVIQYELTGNSWGCDGPCLGNIIVQVSLGSNWVGCETTCAGNIIVQVGVHNNYFECAAGPVVDLVRGGGDPRTSPTSTRSATLGAPGGHATAIPDETRS